MRYVIIGNSAAAIGCVEGIRSVDREGEILLVSRERQHTYSRPLISYLLLGKTDEQRMKYRPDDFYRHLNVQPLLGREVVAVDRPGRAVVLADGERLPYDRLLIATGSAPFVPPIEGLERVQNRFTFQSLDDARALAAALTPGSRVLVLGAGLIGLKCAEGILGRVASLDVVDLADRILPSILDEEGSAMVRGHLEAQGVRFHLGASVDSFQPGVARLRDGAELPFDVLVLAVGVRPNVQLAQDAGCEVDRGVIVGGDGATSQPDIYAAGDCTQCREATTGQLRVLALLPNAYRQGECAGINMAGGQRRFDNPIAMNAIGFFGLHIITAGTYEGESAVTRAPGAYKRLFYRDDRLMGYIMIGKVERAGIYTALIANATPLSSIDFELIKEKPQLMAFSRRERARQLGGQSA